MVVGLLELRLGVFEALSLKDKRRVVKGLKDRLGGRHNVSVAEVDDLDRIQVATLGVAMVANDAGFVESQLRKIVDEVGRDTRASLIDFNIELI